MPNEVFFDLLGLPERPERPGPPTARALGARAQGPRARRRPAHPGGQGGHRGHPGLLRRPAERAAPHTRATTWSPTWSTPRSTASPFADEHIDAASEIMGLMMVLFLGGVETHRGPDRHRCSSCSPRTPTSATLLLADPDADPRRRRGGHPLRHPAAAGRAAPPRARSTLHGVTIPAGGRVVLVYGAANRDERQFADPDRFDVTPRSAAATSGFGEGMHGCLGAPLARLEVKIALEEALPVLGRLRPSPARRSATAPRRTCTSGRTCPLRVPVTDVRHRGSRGPTSRRPSAARRHHRGDPGARRPRSGSRPKEDWSPTASSRSRCRRSAGAPLPPWAPGRARRPGPRRRRRPGSTRCAATPADHRLPTGSASCATPAAAAARGYVHDRLRVGRHRPGPRAAQPLPARRPRRATCSSPAASASPRSCR